MIGIILCLMWSQASKISIFSKQVDPYYLAIIHTASYAFIFVQFALACALVFLPALGLHKTMEAFKRSRDVQFSVLLEKQRQMSIPVLDANDPDQLKTLCDRLKLVQSFDPVALRLSTWPFDRASLVSYGITPVFGVVTAVIKLLGHIS